MNIASRVLSRVFSNLWNNCFNNSTILQFLIMNEFLSCFKIQKYNTVFYRTLKT